MAQAGIRDLSVDWTASTVPDLADAATRARLTPAAVAAIVRLAGFWHLTTHDVCALLGDLAPRTWFRLKKADGRGSLSQDGLTRVSVLLGIFKALRLLFSQPLADDWVRLPNQGALYANRSPLEAMIAGGIPAMLEIRRHLDALRGGL